jgi:hypothetical protein
VPFANEPPLPLREPIVRRDLETALQHLDQRLALECR